MRGCIRMTCANRIKTGTMAYARELPDALRERSGLQVTCLPEPPVGRGRDSSVGDEKDMNDPEVAAICPVCGDATTSLVRRFSGEYSQRYCSACDLKFAWPMTPGDSHYYQSLPYYSRHLQKSTRKRLSTIRQTWEYRAVLDWQQTGRGDLLDIGCGPGEFLFLAREHYGYRVVGLDFNDESVETAAKLYGLKTVISGSWPADSGVVPECGFDLVTMFHVLEHLANPIETLKSAARALKPGALLAVAVPALERRPPFYYGERDLPPHHLTLWSELSLRRAFEVAGLIPVWSSRRPLMSVDFLIYCSDLFPLLRESALSRPLWAVGRRFLAPYVAGLRAVYPALGSVLVGIARRPVSETSTAG